MRSKIAVLGFILLMLFFNGQVYIKEQSVANGRRVVLELAPVDPRSLIQGDYMVLGYNLASKVDSGADKGTIYLKPDSQDLATSFEYSPIPGSVPLLYRRHNGQVKFEIESYLFQEGQRERFQQAKYSEIRVSELGKPTLIRLLDKDLKAIEAL